MIAIIPARGGSKGLPNKNKKWLVDKPLIAHTILEALKADSISKVIVSTDDEEIANISRKYGAEVPFLRPSYLATDTSLAIDTYRFTIKHLEKEESDLESIIILQPTSPLRKSNDIDNAVKLFKKHNADTVISMNEALYPMSWNKIVNTEGSVELQNNPIKNRQDEQVTFIPNGAIYIFNVNYIMENDNYYSENTFAYIMSQDQSIDIDTLTDFKFVEFLLMQKEKDFDD